VSQPERKGRDEPIGIARLDALREARRDSRFRLNVDVNIDSPSIGSASGRTLDLSDHGLSAALPLELPVGEVVQLNFTLRLGRVAVFAAVRNRNEKRHGFQFVEPNPAQLHLIRESCCLLERILPDSKNGGSSPSFLKQE
jgi:PilZ domain-containing protein